MSGLNLRRFHSFHFHPTPKDLHRPNFIFSSDVPEKIKSLYRVYHDNNNSDSEDQLIDLSEHLHINFTVNVELNTLLNRNKHLRPSDLIKDNLIFLAKANDQKLSVNFLSHCMKYDNPLSLNPKRILDNEVFIVSLSLRLLNFIVNGTSREVMMDFLKDENYGILLLCDHDFVFQVENYIRQVFLNELHIQQELADSASNILPRTIDSNCTIIDEIPMNDISGTETTLELSEHEMISKDHHPDDFDDSSFDLSYDKSPKEDDDSATLIHDHKSDDHKMNFTNLLNTNNLNTIKEQNSDDNFIGNMNNLRHNEEHESRNELFIDNDPIKSPIRSISIDDDIRSPQSPTKQSSFPSSIKLKPSKSDLRPDHNYNEEFEFESITRKSSKSNFIPPQPRPLKKSSSSFTIDINDYEDFDVTGPSYIKGDKKFKFIKVGKVQKFVNLFEEKVTEESENTRPSTPTRPSSPSKLVS